MAAPRRPRATQRTRRVGAKSAATSPARAAPARSSSTATARMLDLACGLEGRPATKLRSAALSLGHGRGSMVMQVPLDITFHNIDSSAAAEAAIRDHVARLERIFGHMTGCRVRVDQRNQNSAGTIPPVVRIDIAVPGHK